MSICLVVPFLILTSIFTFFFKLALCKPSWTIEKSPTLSSCIYFTGCLKSLCAPLEHSTVPWSKYPLQPSVSRHFWRRYQSIFLCKYYRLLYGSSKHGTGYLRFPNHLSHSNMVRSLETLRGIVMCIHHHTETIEHYYHNIRLALLLGSRPLGPGDHHLLSSILTTSLQVNTTNG